MFNPKAGLTHVSSSLACSKNPSYGLFHWFHGNIVNKKHLTIGTVGGVLIIWLIAVIHYHVCENMFQYAIIQNPHPQKDLRTEYNQLVRKNMFFTVYVRNWTISPFILMSSSYS